MQRTQCHTLPSINDVRTSMTPLYTSTYHLPGTKTGRPWKRELHTGPFVFRRLTRRYDPHAGIMVIGPLKMSPNT